MQVGQRTVQYRGAVQVETRFRLRLDHPCTVTVEIEDLQQHHIRTVVEPVGVGARLIGCIGGVKDTVAQQVLIYVKDLIGSTRFDAAMHIDVMALMRRAWDANLVVQITE